MDGDFSDNQREWLVSALQEADFLQRKGRHISPTRWFDWNLYFPEWSKAWHQRYMVLVFIGIQAGYLSRQSSIATMRALKKNVQSSSSAAAASTDQTVAGGKRDIQRIRDKCENGMHVSTLVHGNLQFYHLGKCASMQSRSWQHGTSSPMGNAGIGPVRWNSTWTWPRARVI